MKNVITAICRSDFSIPRKGSIVCSPSVWNQLRGREGEKITLRFGCLSLENVALIKDNRSEPMESYFVPSQDLFLSSYLISGLQYKLRRRDESIEVGPTIGFLLGDSIQSYSAKYMRKFQDRFDIYDEIQGLICAFAEENIDWNRKVAYGLYYNPNGRTIDEQWSYGVFPIPSVIYRRYFHNSDDTIERLKQMTGYRVFNSNRFSKYEFYQLLIRDPKLSSHLPQTINLSLTARTLRKFLLTHNEVILKPTDLSRGRGIIYLNYEQGKGVTVIDHRPERPVKKELSGDQLLSYLRREIVHPERYLIQALIPMAQVYSSPFDIRVVMQKNEEALWICNGMEARHAVEGSFVTNLAKGGHATSVDEALSKVFRSSQKVKSKVEEIKEISKEICQRIEEGYPESHFAEFGIDLGIDKKGKIWIIEANVYPSFKGIKHFKMSQYRNIRYTPLRYAHAISGFNKKEILSNI